MSLRILHIYKDYYPVLGGIEGHVRLLAEGQAARGNQVTVLVTNPDGLRTVVKQEHGVRVVRSARLATVASTPLSLALPWELWRSRADVIHLHFPYPIGEISQWGLRRGRRTVLTYHSDVIRQAAILRLYRPLLRRVLRRVDAFVVASPQMRRSLYLAEYQARVHVIPYGLDLARFQAEPDAADLARVRAACSTEPAPAEPGMPVLLFVGRLRYYKGLDVLIRALPDIRARLLVAGTGPMAGEWRALAGTVGVGDRVVWLGDFADADLPLLYHLADLFVLPASHPSEAFGLVQVEAMAAGLPVVCSEVGTGTSYVNQDGVTGRVVPAGQPGVLAGAINELLADPVLRARMSAAARARVGGEFALETMVTRVLALYDQILQ